jgi:hypothetical protein
MSHGKKMVIVIVILVGREHIVMLVPVMDTGHGMRLQKHVLVQQDGKEHIVMPVPVTDWEHGIHLRKSVLVQQAGRERIVKQNQIVANMER